MNKGTGRKVGSITGKTLFIIIIPFLFLFLPEISKAQEKNDSAKIKRPTIENPCTTLYQGWWDTKDIHFNYTDSMAKAFIDTSFVLTIPLLVQGEYVHAYQGRVTSRFGVRRYRFHYGTDIDLETGDSVYASFDGKVRISKYHKGYGNVVLIRHQNGLETVYGHLSKLLVDTNETVKAGDIIGYGGNTGRSTGSHLHFETRYLGIAINPEDLVDMASGTLLNDTLFLNDKNFAHIKRAQELKKAKYHRVKSGECLSVIARKYRTSVSRLCSLNGISRSSTIRIGQRLRVR